MTVFNSNCRLIIIFDSYSHLSINREIYILKNEMTQIFIPVYCLRATLCFTLGSVVIINPKQDLLRKKNVLSLYIMSYMYDLKHRNFDVFPQIHDEN